MHTRTTVYFVVIPMKKIKIIQQILMNMLYYVLYAIQIVCLIITNLIQNSQYLDCESEFCHLIATLLYALLYVLCLLLISVIIC